MASYIPSPQAPRFNNDLRIAATNQIGQGLNQGVNAFKQYQQNQVNKQKQAEDMQVQQGLERIQGIKSLEDYGKTSADQILSQFGSNVSAKNRQKLFGAFEGRDDQIKQQMTDDFKFQTQQSNRASQPAFDELQTQISSTGYGDIVKMRDQVASSELPPARKNALMQSINQREVIAQKQLQGSRNESTYQATRSLQETLGKNLMQNHKAELELQDQADKLGIPLNANLTLDTSNLSPEEIDERQKSIAPLVEAFQKSTQSAQEFNTWADSLTGVAGYDTRMLTDIKNQYKDIQSKRSELSPEAQGQYDQATQEYNAKADVEINTLNLQKAEVLKGYKDVAAITRDEVNMSMGDANQAARKALQAQGMDLDSGDMEDLMGFLTDNLNEKDPYVLVEVAKTMPVISGALWGDADYGWTQDAEIQKKAKEAVLAAKKRKTRGLASLDAIENIDKDIIDKNTGKVTYAADQSAKLSKTNRQAAISLFTKRK